MAKEKKPKSPVADNFIPPASFPYAVRAGDNWWNVAGRFGIDVRYLIWFNFRTNCPEEVNWYLRERVGCTETTADGKNYVFRGADPCKGLIHIPITVHLRPHRQR
jgi:hypothetical protein